MYIQSEEETNFEGIRVNSEDLQYSNVSKTIVDLSKLETYKLS